MGALEKMPGSMGKRIADFCRSELVVLLLVAAARFALHLATNAQYGFHRDERDLNATVQSFPSNVLAGMFGFQQRQYFEAAAVDREPVEVKF